MPIVIRELVIKGVVEKAATSSEKNTPKAAVDRSARAQVTINMIEEIIKTKKER